MSLPVDDLVLPLLHDTHPAARGWLGDGGITAALLAELQTLAASVGPGGTRLRRFAAACPRLGAQVGDYAARRLPTTAGPALAGIRFFGGDTARPFVEVSALPAPAAEVDLDALATQLAASFRIFSPQWMRIFSPAPMDPPPHPRARGDVRLIAGHLAELRRLPPLPAPPGAEAVALRPDPTAACFEAYTEVYRRDHEAEPERRLWLPVEDRPSLLGCGREGGCHQIRVGGEWAGLVAARVGGMRGLSGWEVVDEVLAHPFRGRGLAPHAQRALFRALDAEVAPVIWGTIDARNQASLRTARRAGRTDVGGFWFLPLVDAPSPLLGTAPLGPVAGSCDL